MNLFIDTNIYLNFYHFTSDDLEELKKLSAALQASKIKLFIPRQVISELRRNRESKIADALNKFESQSLGNNFPQISKEYPEYNQLRSALKDYETAKNSISQKLREDIANKSLGADKVVNELFLIGETLEIEDEELKRAEERIKLGNPPGKDGSLGDAINWEVLLNSVPEGEDLYLISGDKDYASPINDQILADFLEEEWRERKKSEIHFYTKLSSFFRDKFPEIKLASEFEKESVINDFINSGSFLSTHQTIRNLKKFPDLTDLQVKDIAAAAVSNDQIYAISQDSDVKDFVLEIANRKDAIPPETLAEILTIYDRKPAIDLEF